MQYLTRDPLDRLTSHLPNIADRTQTILNKVNETSDRVVGKLLVVTDHVQTNLEQTFQKIEAITNNLNNEIQAGINTAIADWLAQHPIIAWILEHPLLTLLLIILSSSVTLGAIIAVFKALGKLGSNLINSPLMAVNFLVNRGKKTTKNAINSDPNTSLSPANFAQIVQRLEALEKTQQQILQQLYKKPENN